VLRVHAKDCPLSKFCIGRLQSKCRVSKVRMYIPLEIFYFKHLPSGKSLVLLTTGKI
jgi:hypothetical protein